MLLEWLLETCSTECFLFKKVKCECYASECYAVDFTDSKNLRNKKKIMVLEYHSGRDRKGQLYGHVTLTYKVKCECYTSECYAVDFTDLKKPKKQKKDHGSSYHSGRDRKGQLYGHVTLTYKVKCECYASECYAVDFTDSKNLRNKKKIMVLAIIVAEIGKVNCMVT